jgi:hypothetical protein
VLDETLHVTHSKQLGDEWLRGESLEIVQVLSRSEEDDRCFCRGDTGSERQHLTLSRMRPIEAITHAEIAPPPFAWPSSLVTMIAPKSAESLKARLWLSAACPIDASSTMMVISCGESGHQSRSNERFPVRTGVPRTGLTAPLIATISSNSSLSCLCRPDVSTMMTSNRSAGTQSQDSIP